MVREENVVRGVSSRGTPPSWEDRKLPAVSMRRESAGLWVKTISIRKGGCPEKKPDPDLREKTCASCA